jgi:hypothetical protein
MIKIPSIEDIRARIMKNVRGLGDLVSDITEESLGCTFWCKEIGSMSDDPIQYRIYYNIHKEGFGLCRIL